MIHTLAVTNYRSLRELVLPMEPLTVVTGSNGVGKSSLYRCLRLLSDTAHGRLVGSLAREGGLPSTLWAGPERISRAMRRGTQRVTGTVRKNGVRMRLGFASDDLGYSLELGLPPLSANAFPMDPEIKREVVFAGPDSARGTLLLNRTRNVAQSSHGGALVQDLPPFESVLTRMIDPARAPEVLLLRERLRAWRFYDTLRTDREAPCRSPQVGTWTPALSHDGNDLAAALLTLQRTELQLDDAFDHAIDDAFPGSRVRVVEHDSAMEVAMLQPGMLRELRARELSEGTLRYLLLTVALLTPYPPPLIVLNEPETSLHPSLHRPLARLIHRASESCQVWVVTHSTDLAAHLVEAGDALHHVLTKDLGETVLQGQDLLDRPQWNWPTR